MQQGVIDRLRQMAEAEQGLVTLDEKDIDDFGFFHPVDVVFSVYYGVKEGHLPEPGGLLDQPFKLWQDVQRLAYYMEVMRHIVRDENKDVPRGGKTQDWSQTGPDGVYQGKMFDGT